MSFKNHSINSFKAPLSQFSAEGLAAGEEEMDPTVNQVIMDNAKLDDQLTDMFKMYCDKFKPLGAQKKGPRGQCSSGQTQSKNALRKVRHICAEAWLKEPQRPMGA